MLHNGWSYGVGPKVEMRLFWIAYVLTLFWLSLIQTIEFWHSKYEIYSFQNLPRVWPNVVAKNKSKLYNKPPLIKLQCNSKGRGLLIMIKSWSILIQENFDSYFFWSDQKEILIRSKSNSDQMKKKFWPEKQMSLLKVSLNVIWFFSSVIFFIHAQSWLFED